MRIKDVVRSVLLGEVLREVGLRPARGACAALRSGGRPYLAVARRAEAEVQVPRHRRGTAAPRPRGLAGVRQRAHLAEPNTLLH
jgi:hypothetical protein